MVIDVWSTPERRALRELVSDFTEKEIVPHLAQWEADGEVPRDLHRKAAEVGLLGVGFPEIVGGSGGDTIDLMLLTEQLILSGASSGLVVSLYTHAIALPHLIDTGDQYLIDRYARPTLAGEKIGSLAVTEPSGGSDVAAIRTRAVRDGDHYVVNGSKTFITSAVRADFVTAAVRTSGSGYRGVSLLVIDKGLPGFTVARKLDKMGWRCSDTAELSFDDVRVPASNLIGTEGSGFTAIMRHFAGERLAAATYGHAIAERCLDLTLEWCRNRATFGSSLIDRQAVRHKLVDCKRKIEYAKAYTRLIIERYAAGAASPDGAQRIAVEAAMAKNTAVEVCAFVTDTAVQLHGGMGYMRESEVERHFRDQRILGIGGGASEVMNDLIAKGLGW